MKKIISILSIIFLMGVIFIPNKVYALSNIINEDQKHNEEVITYVDESLYNPLNNNYLNSCITENDEEYILFSDKSLKDTWQVLLINTKESNNIKNHKVINSYNLRDYIFNND